MALRSAWPRVRARADRRLREGGYGTKLLCFDRSVSPVTEEPGRKFFEKTVGRSRKIPGPLARARGGRLFSHAGRCPDVAGEGALTSADTRARTGVGYHRFALNAESTLCAWHERDREASRSESHVYYGFVISQSSSNFFKGNDESAPAVRDAVAQRVRLGYFTHALSRRDDGHRRARC